LAFKFNPRRYKMVGVCGCIAAAVTMGLSGDEDTRGSLLFGIPKAGEFLRASTGPTLNLLLRASASAFTLKVSHALISNECVF
jgi:hypothetical protein